MKTVLIDFSHLGSFCGFGEIANNFSHIINNMDIQDIHFVYLLPQKYIGIFGDRVSYVSKENRIPDLLKLPMNIDLWHATDQLFNYRKKGKHTIQLLTVHDLNFLHEKHGIHRIKHIFRLRWRVMHSDYVTVISRYVKDDLESLIDMKGKPLQVIYNGVNDIENKAQRRPAFIHDDEEKFFFTIGQIREKKNFHTLVPMMRHLPGYRLYICGDDHFDYAQTIRQTIDECGDGREQLVGKITDEEKNWMYAHCAGFLFPSKLEGFGIPVLEAMRFGCKVFSSRFSSLPEICGKYASYWCSYEPEAMAQVVSDGVSAWRKDSDFAHEMQDYSRGYNYKKYAEEYLALYRKLLAETE